jgi:uncharacterized protein YjaG (DUF416 family)
MRGDAAPLQFDEAALHEALAGLDARRRAAFAAACAERLLPAYRKLQATRPHLDPIALEQALARLWDDLVGDRPVVDEELDQLITHSAELVPESEPWTSQLPYAENAAAAVSYALRCRRSGDLREAVRTARQAHEALDTYVTDELDPSIDLNAPDGEARVIQHPLLQAELARQQQDLLALQADDAALDVLLADLRTRAQRAAVVLFSR